MAATLKDLAPAEKQKVARLIKQVVEKEAAIKELQAALAEARAAAAGAAGAGGETDAHAAALEEQNQELARENTSLRAKLSHAFDLLRTYQHKVRVLDATVAVTGGWSRPTSPGGGAHDGRTAAAGHQGADPQQLAAQLSRVQGCAQGAGAGRPCTPAHGGAAPGCASTQLSPVAEGSGECGCSPSQDEAAAPQAGRCSTGPGCAAVQPAAPSAELGGEGALQLVQPQAALPQLETLKVLAQALLEAQAEVAAKQQQQQQQQQQQRWPPGAAAAPALPPVPAVPAGARLVFDASLGPCGGYLISAPAAAAGAGAEPSQQALCCTASSCREVAAAPALAAPARSPLAALQHLHAASAADSGACSWGGAGTPWSSSCRALEFDGSLTDLVRDVESLGQPAGRRGRGGAAEQAGGHWAPQYEENDLLALIDQL